MRRGQPSFLGGFFSSPSRRRRWPLDAVLQAELLEDIFRWFLTVFSAMPSVAAISLLPFPSVTSSSTPISRGLNAGFGFAPDPVRLAASRLISP